jgi:hypothetical protein
MGKHVSIAPLDPDVVEFVKALARATSARDFAAARKGRKHNTNADTDLRPIFQQSAE